MGIHISLLLILALSCLGIGHTYIFYPLLLRKFAKKAKRPETPPVNADFPEVTIILAVYNEEAVIEEKVRSTFNSRYPQDKIRLLIGSDHSTDRTNALISKLQEIYPGLELLAFPERQGKIKVMNQLVAAAQTEFLIFTDANVFFTMDTISRMVRHFRNRDVDLVCGHILKEDPVLDGVSRQEIYYLDFENSLKYHEYLQFGFCLGAEGGCFALRRRAFRPIPGHFKVDDFFTTLSVIESGGKVVFEREALCREDSTGDKKIELNRKTRIQVGNMQNMIHFRSLMFNPFRPIGFALISHKVIRWFTPILLLLITCSSFLLTPAYPILSIIGIATLFLYLSPIIDSIANRWGIKIRILGFAAHFTLMNWGLLKGIFLFLGSKQQGGPWQPTPRRPVIT